MSNKIHFLNTENSDCIILESNGHFAMIDAGEDNDYPANKPNLNLKGYEDLVCDYLDKNCSINGQITFDFVLATHAHSDHIGGFDTVINKSNVFVNKAYLKPYHAESINIYERTRWDNQEVYDQMKNALIKKKVPIVESFDGESLIMGDFKITFFNGTYHKTITKFGENVNSVVTLVECNGFKILLAGDMNYKNGGERKIAKQVGNIDVLKVGHHGYFGSTSLYWSRMLKPNFSVVCNFEKRIYPDVKFKLKHIAKSKILCTADMNGIVLNITDKLSFAKNIM